MKLIIDRGSTDKDMYTVEFGPDFDVLIGTWSIWMKAVDKKTMAEADRIFTNSPNKVFCVTHIKHPLLLESYNEGPVTLQTFWPRVDDKMLRQPLREYFALRLIHRRYPVDLYEIGKRLFNE